VFFVGEKKINEKRKRKKFKERERERETRKKFMRWRTMSAHDATH
jgi:hypothetical protein